MSRHLRPWILALAGLLCMAVAVARGQEGIKVTGKYTLFIQETPFTLSAPPGGDLYFWKLPPTWNTTDQNDSIIVTTAPEGAYSVSVTVITIQWDQKKTSKATYALSLAVGKSPKPPDPVPPGPTPPDPPMPITGMRVIFVTERQEKLTREQDHILNSVAIADYLDKKCVDGKKGWRRRDKDTVVTTDTQLWTDLWSAVKSKITSENVKLPCVAIADGTKVTIYPLPATEAETLSLLKKFGGEVSKSYEIGVTLEDVAALRRGLELSPQR